MRNSLTDLCYYFDSGLSKDSNFSSFTEVVDTRMYIFKVWKPGVLPSQGCTESGTTEQRNNKKVWTKNVVLVLCLSPLLLGFPFHMFMRLKLFHGFKAHLSSFFFVQRFKTASGSKLRQRWKYETYFLAPFSFRIHCLLPNGWKLSFHHFTHVVLFSVYG